MNTRQKTKYPGVFFREAMRLGRPGTERVYYVVFKKDGKVIEEKVGRQFADNMTEAKASNIRSERLEGRRESRKTVRDRVVADKEALANRPIISRLWGLYKDSKPNLKGLVTDENRYEKHVGPVFGKKTPEEIDPLSIDRFKAKLSKTYAMGTVSNAMELLRRIVNFGANRGLCESPRFKIRLPKLDNERTENLTTDQLQRLLKALDESDNQPVARIMRMALYTGLRRGELLRLQWSDLDFGRNFITLRNTKGGKTERIPMNPQARDLLTSLPRESDFIFPGRNGGQRVELRKAVRKIADAAGLPKDFRGLHGLRHSFASSLASSGQVDLYVLQRLLTHKSQAMTQRYAHLRDDVLQQASAVAGKIFQADQAGASQKVVNLEEFKKG